MVDRMLVALGALIAIVGLFGATLRQEERIAASEIVYLALAPVDPRSLVQGDYLALRYALEPSLPSGAGSGVALLALDERGVATAVRLDDGSPPGPQERRIRFDSRGASKRLAPHAWLFQEGTSPTWEAAEFGIVAIAPDGAGALIGLADAELVRLGDPPRRW